MTTFSETDLNSQNPSLGLTGVAKNYMYESARWGQFLAIVGFIFTALIVIFGLIFSFSFSALKQLPMETMPGILHSGFSFILGFIYVLIGVLYIFPCLYLYRFSKNMKVALMSDSEEVLTEAFSNHKSLFKFMGIFTIVVLGFYAVMFLFGVLGMVSSF